MYTKKRLVKLCVFMVILFFLIIGFYSGLKTTSYQYQSTKINDDLNGLKILAIADLHCASFGSENKKLISAVKEKSPDIIVLLGDLYDENHKDLTPINNLLAGIYSLAPILAVNGNHEKDSLESYNELLSLYDHYNVKLLEDTKYTIQIGNSVLNIYGTDRNHYYHKMDHPISDGSENDFNILLYHYSNLFDSVDSLGYDLVLSGHTHGGVIRLPFLGGLLGTEGSFFPKYDGGFFQHDDCTMISSRGLGSAFVPRFLNRPELVCVTLEKYSNQ